MYSLLAWDSRGYNEFAVGLAMAFTAKWMLSIQTSPNISDRLASSGISQKMVAGQASLGNFKTLRAAQLTGNYERGQWQTHLSQLQVGSKFSAFSLVSLVRLMAVG